MNPIAFFVFNKFRKKLFETFKILKLNVRLHNTIYYYMMVLQLKFQNQNMDIGELYPCIFVLQ